MFPTKLLSFHRFAWLLSPLLVSATNAAWAAPVVTKIAHYTAASVLYPKGKPCSATETFLGEWNGKAYFLRGELLYVTDGTASGTRLLANTGTQSPNKPSSYYDIPMPGLGAIAEKGVILFADSQGGPYYERPYEFPVWFVDPTTGAVDRTFGSKINGTLKLGNRQLMLGSDTLWETDGTSSGTKSLFKFEASQDTSYTQLGVVQSDGSSAVIALVHRKGLDYFVTDGTSAGTRRLTAKPASGPGTWWDLPRALRLGNTLLLPEHYIGKNIARVDLTTGWKEEIFLEGDGLEAVAIAQGKAVFSSNNGFHITDGTTVGTTTISASPLHAALLGQGLVFVEYIGGSKTFDLRHTDLVSSSALLFTGGHTAPHGLSITWLEAIDKKVYLPFDDGVHGFELWATDGTKPGTSLQVDLAPGSASTYYAWLKAWGTGALFSATIGDSECGLYTFSDAVPAATVDDAGSQEDSGTPTSSAVPPSDNSPIPSSGCACSTSNEGTAAPLGAGGASTLLIALALRRRRPPASKAKP